MNCEGRLSRFSCVAEVLARCPWAPQPVEIGGSLCFKKEFQKKKEEFSAGMQLAAMPRARCVHAIVMAMQSAAAFLLQTPAGTHPRSCLPQSCAQWLRPASAQRGSLAVQLALAGAPDEDQPVQKSSRRRRGAWARRESIDRGGEGSDNQGPRSSTKLQLPEGLEGIVDAVTAEFATTEEWEQISDDMLQIYTPSICRTGADVYMRELSTADEAPVLRWIRAETRRRFSIEEASMQIFPEQGKWLSQLVVSLNATKVLELGTFTGYSSTCIAAALPPYGKLVCADVSERFTSVAQEAWQRACLDDKISLHIGDARDYVESLAAQPEEEGTFDLVFVDADKESYLDYYHAAMRLVRPGGAICFDDTLWSGRVVVNSGSQDSETEAIRGLNSFLSQDPRVLTLVNPIGDGVTVAIKRYLHPTPPASASASALASASASASAAAAWPPAAEHPDVQMPLKARPSATAPAAPAASASKRRGGWGKTSSRKNPQTSSNNSAIDTPPAPSFLSSIIIAQNASMPQQVTRPATGAEDGAVVVEEEDAWASRGLGPGGLEVRLEGNFGAGTRDLCHSLTRLWHTREAASLGDHHFPPVCAHVCVPRQLVLLLLLTRDALGCSSTRVPPFPQAPA